MAYKTVPVPDRGVDYQVQAHAIDPRAWTVLDTFRTKTGTIRSFEGWTSILAPALPGPILGISEYLKAITIERFLLLATGDEFFKYDPVLQVASRISLSVGSYAETAKVEFRVPAFSGVVAPTVIVYMGAPNMAGTLAVAPTTELVMTANPAASP